MKTPKLFEFLVAGKATSKFTVLFILLFFSSIKLKKNAVCFSLAILEKERWGKTQGNLETHVMIEKS